MNLELFDPAGISIENFEFDTARMFDDLAARWDPPDDVTRPLCELSARLTEQGYGHMSVDLMRTPDGELVAIRRSDLDDSARHKRPECATCRYDRVCEGVWGNYLRRYGWDEFVPVT